MPVLQEEPTAFPDNLFKADGRFVKDGRRNWWVLRTKPKQEKAVAREHFQRELPYFLPTTRRLRLTRRGEIASYIPLFPGYIFGFVSDAERFEINRTGRLASFVEVADQEKLWAELANLHKLLRSGLEV